MLFQRATRSFLLGVGMSVHLYIMERMIVVMGTMLSLMFVVMHMRVAHVFVLVVVFLISMGMLMLVFMLSFHNTSHNIERKDF
jgi:hypothetical protein